jgi:hypothetical protein
MRVQRFMLSNAYVDAMLRMTQTTHSAPIIFEHNSSKTAYKSATLLTEWEKKSLKAHIRYFLRRNLINGVYRLKETPEGWYIERVKS